MHWIAWVVDPIVMALPNHILDVELNHGQKPMPYSFNWHIMSTMHMLGSMRLVRVDIRCICLAIKMGVQISTIKYRTMIETGPKRTVIQSGNQR